MRQINHLLRMLNAAADLKIFQAMRRAAPGDLPDETARAMAAADERNRRVKAFAVAQYHAANARAAHENIADFRAPAKRSAPRLDLLP